MSQNNVELSEYSKPVRISEYLGIRWQEINLTKEDKKLQDYLNEKGILTIRDIKDDLEISTSSYIGIVRFSNFTVSVTPKIMMNPNNLPAMIEYAYELDDIIITESEIKFLDTSNMLIEIIIFSLIHQCYKILQQGLLKSYIVHQENVAYLRGKLLLQQNLHNIVNKKPQFSCEFDELEFDNLENQIIFHTLDKCGHLTSNDSLKRKIRILLHQFSGFVSKTNIELDDFNKISYSRLNQHYEKTHQLCKLILSYAGIQDFYKRKISFVNSFFVDMNEVFELFVARLCKEFNPGRVDIQKTKKAWISERGNKFFIRTDIIIRDQYGVITAILDTKYKKKILNDDMYQIGFYSHEYDKKPAFAILPKHGESVDDNFISYKQGITVGIRHIDIDDTIKWLKTKDAPVSNSNLWKIVSSLVL